MNVVLHTIGCPKCKVLESKLKQSNIQYEENNDIKLMLDKGFSTTPMLEVGGVAYNFKEAVEWIKEQ